MFIHQKKGCDSLCRQYSVIRPYKPNKHRHPEEGAYEAVNEETWHRHMNEQGRIEDDFQLRKVRRDTDGSSSLFICYCTPPPVVDG